MKFLQIFNLFLLSTAYAVPTKLFTRSVVPTDADKQLTTRDGTKPFYIIAHRVLVSQGVRDALKHGANSVEIDMTAWKNGWYADHDGNVLSRGDTAKDIFTTIADERKKGSTITFVWLDIKNPNYCDLNDRSKDACSMRGLVKLARDILEPAGVRVMYGFYLSTVAGEAWKYINSEINANEAVNLDGIWSQVKDNFNKDGPKNKAQRVMSNGLFSLRMFFGNCAEPSGRWTCTNLRQATVSNEVGKVFGWTVSNNQEDLVDKLLDIASVDGLIYGNTLTHYTDSANTRTVSEVVRLAVKKYSDRYHIATNDDIPW